MQRSPISPVLFERSLGDVAEYVFPTVVLTQNGTSNPKIRSGPGTVRRDERGGLELRMFASEEIPYFESMEFHGRPGEIFPDSAYFDLKATAANGSTWTAERLRINERPHVGVPGSDVRATPRSLTSTAHPFVPFTGFGIDLVVQTDASIACNAEEQLGNVMSRSVLQLRATDGSDVDIYQRAKHLLLLARNATQPVSQEALNSIVEGLAIASGAQMTVSTHITRSADTQTTEIRSMPTARSFSAVWSPFDETRDPRCYIEFVEGYMRLASDDSQRSQAHATISGASSASSEPSFYRCWESVLAAWDQGLFAASGPLSTSIESLLRTWFPERMREDNPAVIAAADALMKHLDTAPVEDALKARARNALAAIKGKSPSAALKSLARDGWFDAELEGAWRHVRNRLAHGGSIIQGEGAEELQKGLDSALRCLHLFYLLPLIRMQFAGWFFDHSKVGFPPARLPPLVTGTSGTSSDAGNAASPSSVS
jgi:hypothetical protein